RFDGARYIHAMRGCSTFNSRDIRIRWRFIHAWRGSSVSTKFDTYQQQQEPVEGGALWVGGV
ncbi:hypothetical protein, partial [Stenotrophomonas maltophilia]|uniref:hypothetical protein n=1 Tax=Stenotrophomonas maltophilia TaxID=40324 RepID=UPI001C6600E8